MTFSSLEQSLRQTNSNDGELFMKKEREREKKERKKKEKGRSYLFQYFKVVFQNVSYFLHRLPKPLEPSGLILTPSPAPSYYIHP